jgi:hypothetical protein
MMSRFLTALGIVVGLPVVAAIFLAVLYWCYVEWLLDCAKSIHLRLTKVPQPTEEMVGDGRQPSQLKPTKVTTVAIIEGN